MILKLKLATVLTLFLFSAITNVAIAEEAMKISVLKSAPLGYIDSDGKTKGTHWNYVQAIAKRSGIKINAVLEPKARLFKNLKLGKTDAAIVFRAKKRDGIVHYAGKIRAIKFLAINLKGNPLNTYPDLAKSRKIGIMKSTLVNKKFDADSSLNKYVVNDYDTMVKMFKRKRITTLTGNAIVMAYLLDKYSASNMIEKPGLTLATKEQWFQISRKSKHSDKVARIQKAILSLQKDGTLDQILTDSVGSGWKAINQ